MPNTTKTKKANSTTNDSALFDRDAVTKGKKTTHPKYRMIEVVNTKGEIWKICSTYKGDKLSLNSDRFTHYAWTRDGSAVDQKADKVAKFNSKYGSLFSKQSS